MTQSSVLSTSRNLLQGFWERSPGFDYVLSQFGGNRKRHDGTSEEGSSDRFNPLIAPLSRQGWSKSFPQQIVLHNVLSIAHS